MKTYYDNNTNQISGMFGPALLTGFIILPIFLAFGLIRFAFSSKEALALSLCIVGGVVLFVETKDFRENFDPPLGHLTEVFRDASQKK